MKSNTTSILLLVIALSATSCAVQHQAHVKGNTIEWTRKNSAKALHTEGATTLVCVAAFASDDAERTPISAPAEPTLTAVVEGTNTQAQPAERTRASRPTMLNADPATTTAIEEPVDHHEARRIAAPAEGDSGGTNTMAILGFIFSLLFPIVGLILSIIALDQIKRTGERGHGLAMAGLIISIVTLLLVIAILA